MMRLGRYHAPMRTGSNRVMMLFNASFQPLSSCIYFIDGWRKQFGQAHPVWGALFLTAQKPLPTRIQLHQFFTPPPRQTTRAFDLRIRPP